VEEVVAAAAAAAEDERLFWIGLVAILPTRGRGAKLVFNTGWPWLWFLIVV
jgi:hypothetical protein